jgi:hypothetical protein
MTMAEAEMLYAQWIKENGPLTPMTVVEMISWVLLQPRRHETEGHRHTAITDESYLLKLGYVHHRDGWHLPSSVD